MPGAVDRRLLTLWVAALLVASAHAASPVVGPQQRIDTDGGTAAANETAAAMTENIAQFNRGRTGVKTENRFGRVVWEFSSRRGEFHDDTQKAAAVIDPGMNTVIRAGLDDDGFEGSADIEEGDLEKGLEAAAGLNEMILEAISETGVGSDKDISPADLFVLNDWIQANYLALDADANPIWVNTDGETVARQLNSGADVYYIGPWADLHGDDDGGRREFGYTGPNVEAGYHLIQNDGGQAALGDDNLWQTVADGIYHLAFDIVEGDADAMQFADTYEEGVDYYFLNEDGDRNESLEDVANWLDSFFLYKDLQTGAVDVPYTLQQDVRNLAYAYMCIEDDDDRRGRYRERFWAMYARLIERFER